MLSFNGYNSTSLTFLGDETIKAGTAVKVNGDATVSACAAGDAFFGACEINRGGVITVQASGYVEMPYSGTAPAYGFGSLVADGNGGVKTGSGRSVTVVKVDTAGKICGFIF